MNESQPTPPLARIGLLWRLPIGFALAIGSWFVSAPHLNHFCGLGYKWFEHYGPYFVALLILITAIAFRRAAISLPLAALVAVVFEFAVIPPYLKWIHGPNAPRFHNASSATQVLEDLRNIEEAKPSEAPKTSNTRTQNQ